MVLLSGKRELEKCGQDLDFLDNGLMDAQLVVNDKIIVIEQIGL